MLVSGLGLQGCSTLDGLIGNPDDEKTVEQPIFGPKQYAQALFDACFVLIDGPDAPDISVTELDKEIILQMNNVTTSGYIPRKIVKKT